MARLEIVWDDGFHMSRTMPAILDGIIDATRFSHFCDQLDAALLLLHIEHRRKRMRAAACFYGLLFCFLVQTFVFHIINNYIPDMYGVNLTLACWFAYLLMIVVMVIFGHSDAAEWRATAKLREICEEMSISLRSRVTFQVAMVPTSAGLRAGRGCGDCMNPMYTVDHISVSVSGMIRDPALTRGASHTAGTPHSIIPYPISENTVASNNYRLMEQEKV
jgi:hypothetical protein